MRPRYTKGPLSIRRDHDIGQLTRQKPPLMAPKPHLWCDTLYPTVRGHTGCCRLGGSANSLVETVTTISTLVPHLNTLWHPFSAMTPIVIALALCLSGPKLPDIAFLQGWLRGFRFMVNSNNVSEGLAFQIEK